MCGKVHKDKDWKELSLQVEDEQTRIFLKLVFELWEGLEKYKQGSIISDTPAANQQSQTRSRASGSGRMR